MGWAAPLFLTAAPWLASRLLDKMRFGAVLGLSVHTLSGLLNPLFPKPCSLSTAQDRMHSSSQQVLCTVLGAKDAAGATQSPLVEELGCQFTGTRLFTETFVLM